jgi:hypothetical protein
LAILPQPARNTPTVARMWLAEEYRPVAAMLREIGRL